MDGTDSIYPLVPVQAIQTAWMGMGSYVHLSAHSGFPDVATAGLCYHRCFRPTCARAWVKGGPVYILSYDLSQSLRTRELSSMSGLPFHPQLSATWSLIPSQHFVKLSHDLDVNSQNLFCRLPDSFYRILQGICLLTTIRWVHRPIGLSLPTHCRRR